jgi:hypothetical protein
MISRYFKTAEENFIARYFPSQTKRGGKKAVERYDEFLSFVESSLPETFSAAHVAIRDRSGYTPDMADFTVFRSIARNTAAIFGSIIPFELACASFHIAPVLDRKTIIESLVRVAHVKRCDRYEGKQDEPSFISSFVITFGSNYSLTEIRGAMVEAYESQDVESDFEVDIVAVLGQGLIVKKWGESRSYAAIETAGDTLMWFYILMREYLDTDKGAKADLRSLVLDQKSYPEY